MKWCKNGVVGIKIEIKGLKKPLISIVSAIEKHKVYKFFRIDTVFPVLEWTFYDVVVNQK